MKSPTERYAPALLSVVLAIALILRLWSIDFGLPYAYHIDEHSYVVGALNLGQGEINGYPQQVGLVNTLLGEYALYYGFGRLTGLFRSAQDLANAYFRDPTHFYLIGRVTSAVLGVLSLLAVYALGKLLRSPRAGVIAALLVAVNFLHVRESHFTTPDVAQGLGFVLVALLCLLALRSQSLKHLLLASLVGGVTIAWKWASVPLLLPICFTAWRVGRRWKSLLFSALIIIGAFVLFSPQLMLFPAPYIEWAKRDYITGSSSGYSGFLIDTVPGWLFYAKATLIGTGIIGMLLSLCGFVLWGIHLVKERDPELMVVVLLLVAYFLLMASSRRYFVRYAVPMVPFFSLAAAEAVEWIWARWFVGRRLARVGFVLLALVLIAQPALASARADYLWAQEDTRTLAKHWIEENIPDGAKIATDWMIHGVPLATADVPQPYSRRVYHVTEIGGSGLSDRPLSYYRDDGYDYLIASSYIYDLNLIHRAENERREAFYQSLDKGAQRVQEFAPYTQSAEPAFMFDQIYGPLTSLWQFDRPGPTLKIYRVER